MTEVNVESVGLKDIAVTLVILRHIFIVKIFFTPNSINCAILRHSVQQSFKLYFKLLKSKPEIIEKLITSRNNIKSDMSSIMSCQNNSDGDSLPAYTVKPIKRNDIQFHSVNNEQLLYDPESQHVSTINQSAKAIWDYCDGQNDILTISKKLTEQFDCFTNIYSYRCW